MLLIFFRWIFFQVQYFLGRILFVVELFVVRLIPVRIFWVEFFVRIYCTNFSKFFLGNPEGFSLVIDTKMFNNISIKLLFLGMILVPGMGFLLMITFRIFLIKPFRLILRFFFLLAYFRWIFSCWVFFT